MFLLPSPLYATDLQPCQINSWSPSYPSQVNPGQTIHITSTLNVACGQWRTYYTARVDLVNRVTGQWYSTTEFQIGWQPDVNATITNSATAPQTAGPWQVQYNLYIFEEGSQDGNTLHDTLNINVADSNTSQQNAISETNSTSAAPAALPQAPATNATSITSQNTAEAIAANPPSVTAYVAVALAIAAIVGLAVLLLNRKK